MADQIKCGRKIFDLVKGDRVMDNGFCLQLITRKVGSGFHKYSPIVSKASFKKFMGLNVKSVKHGWCKGVTIWEYQGCSQ